MAQSRTMSVVETVTQNVIGFVIAMAVQALVLPYWGFHPTLAENFWITFIFMAISVIRSYIFRRFFAYLEARQDRRAAAPTPAGLMAMMAMSQEECEFWMRPQWEPEEIVRTAQH
jgi:membrane protein implicated in regulation of membrane protease activity